MERYVPQVAQLPHCDLVVSHAGSGTFLSALALGLPQLCLPQGADQFLNAASITSTGAGLCLMPGEATADAVREAASRLLDEGSFRQAASQIGRSIAQMPSVDEVTGVLERLV